jgi:hypothetical protein
MRIKNIFWYLLGMLLLCVAVNSCKKDNNDNITNLLTKGRWQLASMQVYHFIGDSQISTDTLNTDCDTTQLFTFFKDKVCTYTNYDCKVQPIARGTWSLSDTKLVLNADITCQDNSVAGSLKPFLNAQIQNLGDFSLVVQTGDTQNYYSPTQPRTIYRYAFIRQKEVTTQ